MSDKDFVLETMKRYGKAAAQAVQAQADSMTGTELNGEGDYLPDFVAARKKTNMRKRSTGFVCKSSAGRVVKLIQPYNSDVYTQEPEDLAAQWGFVWSNDPAHAKPFVAIATSPYMTGNCCTEDGETYRSTIDNNVWAPSAYPQGWEKV